jgi:hypothetical protein
MCPYRGGLNVKAMGYNKRQLANVIIRHMWADARRQTMLSEQTENSAA